MSDGEILKKCEETRTSMSGVGKMLCKHGKRNCEQNK